MGYRQAFHMQVGLSREVLRQDWALPRLGFSTFHFPLSTFRPNLAARLGFSFFAPTDAGNPTDAGKWIQVVISQKCV
jgi:hypothetical protein